MNVKYIFSSQKDAENLYKKIVHLKPKATTGRNSEHGGGFFGLWCRTDLVNKHKKKLEKVEDNVRLEHSDVLTRGKVHNHEFCWWIDYSSCFSS